MVPNDEREYSEDQTYENQDEFGFESIGQERTQSAESSGEELSPILRWIDLWAEPVRDAYTQILKGITPFYDFWTVTNQAIVGWFERRHIIPRIFISIIGTELLAQSFLFFWKSMLPIEMIGGTQPTVEVPPYVPLITAGIALIVLFQWLQMKYTSGYWIDSDGLPPHIRVAGAGSGLVVGGSVGSLIGIQGIILGFAIGIVLGDEIERRVDRRISEAKTERAQLERTLLDKLESLRNQEKGEESLNLSRRE